MSHASNPNPSLPLRAALYTDIRDFFAKRGVMEVETPLLSQHTVTDPHIDSFQTQYSNNQQTYFLQTSPEYAMKRLLCAGSGAIFQICKAFRQGEFGAQHNPEFTMLEWYRPGFNHHDLMDEIDQLLQRILITAPAEKITYQDLFLTHLAIDPFAVDLVALKKLITQKEIDIDLTTIDHDTALQILLTHSIEPNLGRKKPLFLYDFPASQAALAKIHHQRAERFELYIDGCEIANGFHELTNPIEQEKRFINDQQQRKAHQKFIPDIDQRFINALHNGLPDCAGVAVGIDRLLMQLAKTNHIHDVICFPWDSA